MHFMICRLAQILQENNRESVVSLRRKGGGKQACGILIILIRFTAFFQIAIRDLKYQLPTKACLQGFN